jgi:alpha-L-fucosidase
MSTSQLTRALVVFVLWLSGCASSPDHAEPRGDPRLDWWRDARFGLFIHWGLYAVPAGQWKDETNHGEWIMTTAKIPVEQYETFRERFDPVKFDADAWVRTAKDAGMKYIVITSKHHDGFCLFDSKYTDYDVMSTPFKRDILKELSDACRKHGLAMCWYHSIMDWHHPDYLPRRDSESRSAADASFPRYVEHLKDQVTELLTNYGPIGVMWFDGEWEPSWTNEYGQELYDLCRRLQPDVIVNNRVSTGRGGMAGMTAEGDFPGDFGTPEQEIPAQGIPGVDWETCMTMNEHWGYNALDTQWKSSTELVRNLIDIASKGGNFLLNVGPTAEGEFPPACVERLRDMGAWLETNGEAIYGTSASPFASLPWGRCTMRPHGDTTTLYLHVFDWPADGRLEIGGLGNEIERAFLLVQRDRDLPIMEEGGTIVVQMPREMPDGVATVLALEIEGAPIVFEAPRIVSQSSTFVERLPVALATRSKELEVRYTLDGSEPSASSKPYRAPIELSTTTTVRARSFYDGRPVSATTAETFERVQPHVGATTQGLQPGLVCEHFEGEWTAMPNFQRLVSVATTVERDLDLGATPREERAGRRYRGFITVPDEDLYLFGLKSDDGARLWIDGELVVDNDGLHTTALKSGAIALGSGAHAISVEYFNRTGGAELGLAWGRLGEKMQPVPAHAFGR